MMRNRGHVRERSMVQRILLRLFAVLFGLALGWGASELALGCIIRQDADGNRYFRKGYLCPYHMPLHRLREMLTLYHSSDSTAVVYSPELGWDSRPVVTASDGRRVVSPGFRAHRSATDYTPSPPPDTVRILLFGDSFTACPTTENESWGWYLESGLLAHDVPVQVLNFGMGGYGIDQAYLRWKKYGRAFAPDIVIFGFQPENVMRDLNLIRLIYTHDTGLPFSKPRFVRTDGRLELVNCPAAPPDSLPHILAHLPDWPLLRYETFYAPEEYRSHWWLRSRVIAFATAVPRFKSVGWAAEERRRFDPASEGGGLALDIVRRFRDDVTSAGATFLVVHLPRRVDLTALVGDRPVLTYSALLDELRRQCTVIDPIAEMRRAALDGGVAVLFRKDSHYNARGNRAVGDALARYFLEHGMGVARVDTQEGRRPPRAVLPAPLHARRTGGRPTGAANPVAGSR